jgi:DNA invertase Pin-like site-specific DNA recombinase
MISARTKAALAAAKARGVQLGNARLLARDPTVSAKRNAAQVENARRRAAAVLRYIEGARRAGAATLVEIAEALMARGVPAPRAGQHWAPAQVRRIMIAATQVA